ncbi:MAG: hypothetical protein JO126_03615 [Alphaproteobacteria bacterium]|nr:hypothetical protein [Alphaproteobacteria bacterium]
MARQYKSNGDGGLPNGVPEEQPAPLIYLPKDKKGKTDYFYRLPPEQQNVYRSLGVEQQKAMQEYPVDADGLAVDKGLFSKSLASMARVKAKGYDLPDADKIRAHLQDYKKQVGAGVNPAVAAAVWTYNFAVGTAETLAMAPVDLAVAAYQRPVETAVTGAAMYGIEYGLIKGAMNAVKGVTGALKGGAGGAMSAEAGALEVSAVKSGLRRFGTIGLAAVSAWQMIDTAKMWKEGHHRDAAAEAAGTVAGTAAVVATSGLIATGATMACGALGIAGTALAIGGLAISWPAIAVGAAVLIGGYFVYKAVHDYTQKKTGDYLTDQAKKGQDLDKMFTNQNNHGPTKAPIVAKAPLVNWSAPQASASDHKDAPKAKAHTTSVTTTQQVKRVNKGGGVAPA